MPPPRHTGAKGHSMGRNGRRGTLPKLRKSTQGRVLGKGPRPQGLRRSGGGDGQLLYFKGRGWAAPLAPPRGASAPTPGSGRPATRRTPRRTRPCTRSGGREPRARPGAESSGTPRRVGRRDFLSRCPGIAPSRVLRPGTSGAHTRERSPGLGAIKGNASGEP